MIVYCLENTVNGKRYVGQTIKTLEFRWNSHLSDMRAGSDLPVHLAIAKYGPDAFKRFIIQECLSEEELDVVEIAKIKELETHVSTGKGYNVTWGGSNLGSGEQHPCFGRKISEEQKRILSEAQKGKENVSYKARGPNHWNRGLIRSAETREKLRAARKRQGNPRQDYTVSQETREKIRTTLLTQVTPEFRQRQSEYGKLGARTPDQMRKVRHIRWHVKRGITNPSCEFCTL